MGYVSDTEGNMNKIFRILIVVSILQALYFSEAVAIDTSNWENKASHFISAKPEKEFLVDLAFWSIIRGVKDSKTKGYYDRNKLLRYLNGAGDSIKIPIKPAWNDIAYFSAKYSITAGKPSYVMCFEFREHSFPVIDVMGRYGYELAELTTDQKLEKEITYRLRKHMYDTLYDLKHPLKDWAIILSETGQVAFHFRSEDGVFVESLIITFLDKEAEPTGQREQ